MLIRTILHPTDYSELLNAAFGYALELARVHHANLIVLHAVETRGPEMVSFGEAGQPQPETYRRRLWEELRQAMPKNDDVPVEYELSEDDPVTAIVRTASERKCDLIVLGSRGRRGIKRLLEGSIAEKVMRASPCPVLVLKCPTDITPTPNPGTPMHPHKLSEQQR